MNLNFQKKNFQLSKIKIIEPITVELQLPNKMKLIVPVRNH